MRDEGSSPSPDGDTVAGGRGRSARPPVADGGDFTTPAGVADQIPGGVNSLRDRCRGRKNPPRSWFRWSLASLGPPATVRVASGDVIPHPSSLAPASPPCFPHTF